MTFTTNYDIFCCKGEWEQAYMKKMVVYLFKLAYLVISWFVITYTCNGDINVNLFCISIFTYSGGVVFDSIFYFSESYNTNTVLRGPVILLSAVSFVGNLFIAICSIISSQFIIISFDEALQKYMISFRDMATNGFVILYPKFADWRLDLSLVMTFIMFVGVFSLLPAFLLEVDSYIRMINDKYDKTKKESR